jgi:hypothetical protein
MRGGSAVEQIGTGLGHSFGAGDANNTTATGSLSATVTAEAGARTGGAGSFFIRGTSTATNYTLRVGRANLLYPSSGFLRVRFWARCSVNRSAQLSAADWVTNTASAEQTISVTTDWQLFEANLIVRSSLANGGIYLRIPSGGSGDLLDIDDLQVFFNGAITHPAPLRDTLINADATGIGNVPGRIVGGNVVSEEPRTLRTINATTLLTGNNQLFGGPVFTANNTVRLARWSIDNRSGGTRVVSLGSASAGTQYAASVTCPVGRTDVILTGFTNITQNLWINTDSAGELVHTIAFEEP